MQAGKHQATIFDYGITKTKAGAPQVVVQFVTQDGEKLTWYGGLSEKSAPFTLKALIAMGIKVADASVIALGPDGGALDSDTPVSLEVEMEMTDGKERARVKWVNKLGGNQFERISRDEAKVALGGFAGDLAQMLKQAGVKPQNNTTGMNW